MAETQRQAVPRVDGSELETALAFLDFARECVIKKADGLDEEQARRVLVESGTTLIGLLWHLVDGERWWFGYHVDGDPAGAEVDFEMAVPSELTVADVVRAYRAAIEDSNAIIRRVADPDAPMAQLVDGQRLPLRWVLAHMTSETARHAGHADLLREQIDGTTGR